MVSNLNEPGDSLHAIIEKLRRELISKAQYTSFTDPSIIELSQRLDHYVVLAQLKKKGNYN
ncbi:Spo0E family sporulation regulatory protein-aspartic acid phosphatase [Paenibacillus kribbensis]|uniref:Spo0E family sporulation regulatory protein-aspartic acid phosphatase n=1 Tax=Paenibacillus kribbensis TaxID=172713 RepID=A0A222WH26_9BACL|nr:aspartyl-phosphate phosphatase Spo0E family protein [Paenibacillus kribbensis]ASR45436.1 Spo0E family sporulation regulatory protein-aspartic acid phosphatase [Paenibacillus kribbensis]